MNKKIYKDYKYRQKLFPLRLFVLKTIRNSPSLYSYKRNIYLLKKFERSNTQGKFHDFCFISGRSKSVYSHFHLGRNFLKTYINSGFIPGWKKTSW